MAIVTFWSDSRKETAQTSSLVAVATHLAMEKNLRILLVDATFLDETITRAYWRPQKQNKFFRELNGSKMDIGSGSDGLVTAIASNKATPEIIANYTKAIYNKNRLDFLPGLKTKSQSEFEKSLVHYKELLLNANKYYDMVFVDLEKTTSIPAVKAILGVSSIIMYTMVPNILTIDKYRESIEKYEFLKKNNIIPILGRSDEFSKYNPRNVGSRIGEKFGVPFVSYNIRYAESICEGLISDFFLKSKTGTKDFEQELFFDGLNFTIERIQYKLQELQIR